MYEPAFLPTPNRTSALLPTLRFLLTHNKTEIQSTENTVLPIGIHNCYELFVCDSTPVTFLVNNKLYRATEGTALLIKPGDIHACIFHRSCSHSFYSLWIDAEPCSPFVRLLDGISENPIRTFDREDTRTLQTLLSKLDQSTPDDCADLETATILLEIISLLKDGKPDEEAPVALPAPLQAILDDVNENFAKIHHVHELAQSHSVSITTLNRWFRHDLRVSPHDLLESKKLAHSMRLLSAGESVTDACAHSGFSECSHFIRRFKAKFNTTPFKFRQRAD